MNLHNYTDFVKAVTSDESNNSTDFEKRYKELSNTTVQGSNINIPLLITAAFGLSAESGEFTEVPKKILLQGKPLDKDSVFHMKRELGDIIFYWINACRALNLDPNAVIQENINKLEARYPGGKFDVQHSENRKENDL